MAVTWVVKGKFTKRKMALDRNLFVRLPSGMQYVPEDITKVKKTGERYLSLQVCFATNTELTLML